MGRKPGQHWPCVYLHRSLWVALRQLHMAMRFLYLSGTLSSPNMSLASVLLLTKVLGDWLDRTQCRGQEPHQCYTASQDRGRDGRARIHFQVFKHSSHVSGPLCPATLFQPQLVRCLCVCGNPEKLVRKYLENK